MSEAIALGWDILRKFSQLSVVQRNSQGARRLVGADRPGPPQRDQVEAWMEQHLQEDEVTRLAEYWLKYAPYRVDDPVVVAVRAGWKIQ